MLTKFTDNLLAINPNYKVIFNLDEPSAEIYLDKGDKTLALVVKFPDPLTDKQLQSSARLVNESFNRD